ncbi:hypothetical protein BH18VER1_BH18VER1_10460 [soil metagenome]
MIAGKSELFIGLATVTGESDVDPKDEGPADVFCADSRSCEGIAIMFCIAALGGASVMATVPTAVIPAGPQRSCCVSMMHDGNNCPRSSSRCQGHPIPAAARH